MSIATDTRRNSWEALVSWYYGLNPTIRLILRWILIAVLTVVAFRASLSNLVVTTREGGLVGYVWVIPFAALLAAVGVAIRRRTELPIHDRQTDIIVGTMGLVLALMFQGVLLRRYAEYFHLLRLDLFAMWIFVLSSAIVLFGVRPVARFGWVWLLTSMVFSLPYQVMVIVLGGGTLAAAVASLFIAAPATAVAVGGTHRRAFVGAVAAFALGLMVLLLMHYLVPGAPLLAYQLVPSLAPIVLVGGVAFFRLRRGKPLRVLDRKVEPLAAKQVWAAVPLVVAVAVVLAFIPLPKQQSALVISRSAPYDLVPGLALVVPSGWAVTKVETNVDDVRRYYGEDAVLVRQRMTALSGDARFDKFARPRTLMVDSIVSSLPYSFDAYTGRVLYDTTGARLSRSQPVDLGHGVHGRILSVIDDRLLVTWDVLRFAWGDDEQDQIVGVFAVDNHENDAPFPDPRSGLVSTLRDLFTVLFRGNAVTEQNRPTFKDAELLTEFGRQLVAAQFEHGAAAHS
ncbi:hypothetical protein [Mycobacterium sp. OTB74]|uniref:hypothetical protein n=1 Tax=Mycobacterium sp. OTB74 TaxID=1853452 RepID=UPI0024733A70|nr:hypothetical protein [Mycobacterium sp. OTB74]MDH6244792.1 hypothetical protein [Mycobacterium sp. OTB74]